VQGLVGDQQLAAQLLGNQRGLAVNVDLHSFPRHCAMGDNGRIRAEPTKRDHQAGGHGDEHRSDRTEPSRRCYHRSALIPSEYLVFAAAADPSQPPDVL
jgi:hypothetical protein